MKWFHDVEQITRDLIRAESVYSEKTCADAIIQHLKKPIAGDVPTWDIQSWDVAYNDTAPVERGGNIACLLRGKNAENNGDTLILMAHYDTVGVDDYESVFGNAGIAFDPDSLHEAILERINKGEITRQRVIDDAQQTMILDGQVTPAWMFGRGSVDMKSGIAIHIAVMRSLWTQREMIKGNVLLLVCPDEEKNSAGMLSAVKTLQNYAIDQNLKFIGAVNTDYTVARDDARTERYVYTGTVGKLLPSFYILGETTHVGEPFRGLDATHVAAEIATSFNLNVTLSDMWQWRGDIEIAVPPIVLKMRDLKSTYNVQTAPAAFIYINWLTFHLTPEAVLQKSVAIAQKALQTVEDNRFKQFNAYQGVEQIYDSSRKLPVITFEQLIQKIVAKKACTVDDVNTLIQQLIVEIDAAVLSAKDDVETLMDYQLAEGYDERELGRLVVQELVKEAELHAPAVVVYFSPPYYPHIKPNVNPLTEALNALIDTTEFQTLLLSTAKSNSDMVVRNFYPYISDMSFVRLDNDIQQTLTNLTDNMPLYRSEKYRLPLAAMADLDCPVINLGPYGEAAHGVYERVHKTYSFETVPQLLHDLVRRLL